MSLELKIEALTEAVIELTNAMREKTHATHVTTHAAPAPAPAPVASPAVFVPAPVVVAVPEPVPAAVVVPAPSFAAPFTDAKGLTEYCMRKYSELGPVKGGNIQAVLTSIGCKNLSEVTPDKYADFYTKVEAL